MVSLAASQSPFTPLTICIVANTGLGKDMWTLPIDNITHILYVSTLKFLFPALPKVRCLIAPGLLLG